MKGLIVRNKYYTDAGMEYAYARIAAELNRRGIGTEVVSIVLSLDRAGRPEGLPAADFAVYWNKDAETCLALEGVMRCFNRSAAIALCDDKLKTYLALGGLARVPRSVASPLMYPASCQTDGEFLETVKTLGFPLIAKCRVGSRGEQVSLVQSEERLKEVYGALKLVPHLYEEYVPGGETDTRVYVVGSKAIGAVSRTGVGFKSNAFAGAKTTLCRPDPETLGLAEKAAERLGLDYCAVDFLLDDGPVLLEVNSNAYFTGAECAGLDVAGRYADHIEEVMRHAR